MQLLHNNKENESKNQTENSHLNSIGNSDKTKETGSTGNSARSRSKSNKLSQIYYLFIQFCENTSLRGIPRIVKAQDRRRKLLWVTFVIIFFIGCITCLILIVNQYMQYDVIHQPKTIFETPRSFPSITLCNLRPFKSSDIERLKRVGVIPVQEYFDLILSVARTLPRSKASLVTSLLSLESYLLNLPSELSPKDLGHFQTQLIRSCIVLYRNGTSTRGTECLRVGSWIKSQDRIYHNCYTYQVGTEISNQTLSIELVLYLNNVVKNTLCFDCQDRLRGSQLTGARLLLSPDSEYPRILEEGINLMPGTLTDIRFVVREWLMMTPPYGRCNPNAPSKIAFGGPSYSYSEYACQHGVIQELVANKCKCLSYDRPIPNHLMHSKLPFCQYFELPLTNVSRASTKEFRKKYFTTDALDRYVAHQECSQNITRNTEAAETGCMAPCFRYTYDTSISSAQWPTKPYAAHFARQLMSEEYKRRGNQKNGTAANKEENEQVDQSFMQLLEPYVDILDTSSNHTEQEAVQKLLELQNIEKNFLSIIVSRANFDIIRVEEKAVVTLTSLFSQIGGLLSIWVGITMICIVEVAELLMNIIDIFRLPRH